MRHLVLAALLCAATPAAAQGVPEALRGTWAAGSCAAPTALLHVTARSVARLPAETRRPVLDLNRPAAVADWLLDQGERFEYVAERYGA